MANITILETSDRLDSGSADSVRLRRQGRVPAVIYGGDHESTPISLEVRAIDRLIDGKRLHGMHRLRLDGRVVLAVIKELEWDAYESQVLQLEFQRVRRGEVVTVELPIELHGLSERDRADGVLAQDLQSVEIQCAVEAIPEEIELNVTDMKIGDEVRVRDLSLPDGVRAVTDEDHLVLTIVETIDKE